MIGFIANVFRRGWDVLSHTDTALSLFGLSWPGVTGGVVGLWLWFKGLPGPFIFIGLAVVLVLMLIIVIAIAGLLADDPKGRSKKVKPPTPRKFFSSIFITTALLFGLSAYLESWATAYPSIYIKADLSRANSGLSHVPLLAANDTGGAVKNAAFWISCAKANRDASREGYECADKRERPLQNYTQGLTNIRRSVPPGHYLIEINADESFYIQSLRIEPYKDKLIQMIEIYDEGGREVFRNKRPVGF